MQPERLIHPRPHKFKPLLFEQRTCAVVDCLKPASDPIHQTDDSWCDECQGYTHMPYCSKYDGPEVDLKEAGLFQQCCERCNYADEQEREDAEVKWINELRELLTRRPTVTTTEFSLEHPLLRSLSEAEVEQRRDVYDAYRSGYADGWTEADTESTSYYRGFADGRGVGRSEVLELYNADLQALIQKAKGLVG